MPTTYKVLGQTAPASTILTDLYIVPSSTETVISSLVVANRSTSASDKYRIAISPDGATLANEQYIAYDVIVPPADSVMLTLGLTINSADRILVYSLNGSISFSLFGMELS
jgi:hypothetical protein